MVSEQTKEHIHLFSVPAASAAQRWLAAAKPGRHAAADRAKLELHCEIVTVAIFLSEAARQFQVIQVL